MINKAVPPMIKPSELGINGLKCFTDALFIASEI